jgi:hypothetical protein
MNVEQTSKRLMWATRFPPPRAPYVAAFFLCTQQETREEQAGLRRVAESFVVVVQRVMVKLQQRYEKRLRNRAAERALDGFSSCFALKDRQFLPLLLKGTYI